LFRFPEGREGVVGKKIGNFVFEDVVEKFEMAEFV